MKLIQAVKTPKSNNIQSKQSVQFQIGDAGKIIDILRSKIYSNPIQTLVQEYLCNARDAVREVKGNKIVVTLPSEDNLMFKVRDFGPGIDKDRMLNCFVFYGNTTKDGSNNQTGGFGLGSKLAWAYTDAFNIVTYVNRVQTTYIAHINSSKNGQLELVSEEPTTEPNGTEIQIEVKADDTGAFSNATRRAVSLWNTSEMPEIYYSDETFTYDIPSSLDKFEPFTIYSENVLTNFFKKHELDSKMILSIDGVGYPLSSSFVQDNETLNKLHEMLSHNAVIVFHLGNGQIEVAASRESISENERTLKVVSAKAKTAFKALHNWKIDTLEDSRSLSDFISNLKAVGEVLQLRREEYKTPSNTFTVNVDHGWGSNPTTYTLNNEEIDKLDVGNFSRDGSKKRSKSWQKGINLNNILIIADESISKARQTMKIAQAFKMTMASEASLIFQGSASTEFFNILKDLFGKSLRILPCSLMLSEITLPKVERADAKRIAEGCIKVQILKGDDYRDRRSYVEREIHLETNNVKFVYISQDNRRKVEEYKSLRIVLNHNDVSVCFLTNGAIKKIEGDRNFVSVETFLAKPQDLIGKKGLRSLIASAKLKWSRDVAGQLYSIGTDSKLLGLINDKQLATDLKTLCDEHENIKLYNVETGNDFLMDHIVNSYGEVRHVKELSDSFPKYVKKNYPMVEFIQHYNDEQYDSTTGKYVKQSFTSEMFNMEIIAYLNGKFQG